MRKGNWLVVLLILAGICLAAKAQCPQFELGLQVGTVANDLLDEISGIAASLKNTDVFWVHNDRGGLARVWALNSEGTHLGIYNLSGANNRDWEDIAIGPGPVDGVDYLYVGNIGGGGAPNAYITVYRVAEPTVDSQQPPVETTLTGVDAINLEYPDGDQYRDAETLMLDTVTKDIYIISKEDIPPRVYRAPYPQSTTSTITMEHVCNLPSPWDETSGGDISLDGGMIIVRDDDDHASIWLRPEGTNLWEAFSGTECSVELPSPSEINGESICFDAEGKGYYTTTEREGGPKPPIYYFASVGIGFPGTIYVDADATGANDGSSWEDAFNYLQDALADARNGDEIRVAGGIYKPDEDTGNPTGTGDREATFQLKKGVSIKGGYAGYDESDPNIRDIETYETILSGDLDGNDVVVNDPCDLLTEPTRLENSYHIVTGISIDKTAVLDGFTITAGNANGSPDYERDRGGGMFNNGHDNPCNPTVAGCTFFGNSCVEFGGGMFNYGHGDGECNPIITDCTFLRNASGSEGGGMSSWGDWGGHSVVTNCTFGDNYSRYCGGGMTNAGSNPTVSNCTFSDNSTDGEGGGMWNYEFSSPLVIDCIFRGNSSYYGGGMHNRGSFSNPTLTNCTFSGNTANNDGGGMRNYYSSSPTLTNCTFSGNSAQNNGGGIYNYSSSNPRLTNCILWGNDDTGGTDESAQIHNHVSSTSVINNTCIHGWTVALGGFGNIGSDPFFAEPNNGDYHLKSEAGRWDANGESWEQDAVTSPCIDAGDIKSPIGLEPFPNGGMINMGAYGGTAEASKSYFGEPVCTTIVAGDINGDCIVNFVDFALMAAHWLENNNQ